MEGVHTAWKRRGTRYEDRRSEMAYRREFNLSRPRSEREHQSAAQHVEKIDF